MINETEEPPKKNRTHAQNIGITSRKSDLIQIESTFTTALSKLLYMLLFVHTRLIEYKDTVGRTKLHRKVPLMRKFPGHLKNTEENAPTTQLKNEMLRRVSIIIASGTVALTLYEGKFCDYPRKIFAFNQRSH